MAENNQTSNRETFHDTITRLTEMTEDVNQEAVSLEAIRELTASTMESINTGNVFGRSAAKSQLTALAKLTSQVKDNGTDTSDLLKLQEDALAEIKNQHIGQRFKDLGSVIANQTKTLTKSAADVAKEGSSELSFIIGVALILKSSISAVYGAITRNAKNNADLASVLSSIEGKLNKPKEEQPVDPNTSILDQMFGSISNIETVVSGKPKDSDDNKNSTVNPNQASHERQRTQNARQATRENNNHNNNNNANSASGRRNSKESKRSRLKRGALSVGSFALLGIVSAVSFLGTAISSTVAFILPVLKTLGSFIARAAPMLLRGLAPLMVAVSPFLIKIGLIVGAIYSLYKIGSDLFDNIGNAGKILEKDNVTFMDKVAVGIGSVYGTIGGLIDWVGSLFGFDTNFKDAWTKDISKFLSKFFENVVNKIASLGDFLKDFSVSKYVSKAFGFVTSLFDKLTGYVKGMVNDLLGLVGLEGIMDDTITVDQVTKERNPQPKDDDTPSDKKPQARSSVVMPHTLAATALLTGMIKDKDGLISKATDSIDEMKKTMTSLQESLEDEYDYENAGNTVIYNNTTTGQPLPKKIYQDRVDHLRNRSKSQELPIPQSQMETRVKHISESYDNELKTKPKYKSPKKGEFNELEYAMKFNQKAHIIGLNEAEKRALAANTAKTESAGQVDVVNDDGYMGLYQMGADALADMGFVDLKKLKAAKKKGGWWSRGNHKKFTADKNNWIKSSPKEFLNDKNLQDKTFIRYTNTNIKRGIRSGSITKNTPAVQIAAYSKAAHLTGSGGADDLFKNGVIKRDGNGTSSATYSKQAIEAIKTLAPVVQKSIDNSLKLSKTNTAVTSSSTNNNNTSSNSTVNPKYTSKGDSSKTSTVVSNSNYNSDVHSSSSTVVKDDVKPYPNYNSGYVPPSVLNKQSNVNVKNIQLQPSNDPSNKNVYTNIGTSVTHQNTSTVSGGLVEQNSPINKIISNKSSRPVNIIRSANTSNTTEMSTIPNSMEVTALAPPNTTLHTLMTAALRKPELNTHEGATNLTMMNNSDQKQTPTNGIESRATMPMQTRDSENLGRIPVASRTFGKDYA